MTNRRKGKTMKKCERKTGGNVTHFIHLSLETFSYRHKEFVQSKSLIMETSISGQGISPKTSVGTRDLE